MTQSVVCLIDQLDALDRVQAAVGLVTVHQPRVIAAQLRVPCVQTRFRRDVADVRNQVQDVDAQTLNVSRAKVARANVGARHVRTCALPYKCRGRRLILPQDGI